MINKSPFIFAMIFALLIGCAVQRPESLTQKAGDPLAGLGGNHFQISTDSGDAQAYFDRGLILAYAFNHQEAERAFQKALQIDAGCAMCYWGLAYVLGPNINAPMEPSVVAKAYAAAQSALALSSRASAKEQSVIAALVKRYGTDIVDDRAMLNQAYADAMRRVVKAFPKDADLGTLFAEALMNQHPWDYWTPQGKPKPWAGEIVATLENVLIDAPIHPGANHLYIHAVEASDSPERGLLSADRLGDLVPAAGHLVHMPAHIYIRTGDYEKAIAANEKAVLVDQDYMKHGHRSGIYPLAYVPHNHHFLWAAASKAGCSVDAMAAAASTAEHADTNAMRQPGMGALEHYYTIPTYAMVRFGKWRQILNLSKPALDLRYANAVWHYARGMAYVGKHDLDSAQVELASMNAIAAEPAVAELSIWEMNTMGQILDIANHVLRGEIAAAQSNTNLAVKYMRQAIQLEDALHYNEPSDWVAPVRQSLGAVLLSANRFVEAESVYREDLARNPETGWSLFGLAASLKAQHKIAAANAVQARFDKAWSKADVVLKESRIMD